MQLKWTKQALSDVVGIYNHLAAEDKFVATRIVQSLTIAPVRFLDQPQLGEILAWCDVQEIRLIQVGQYDMLYTIADRVIYVLGVWHADDNR